MAANNQPCTLPPSPAPPALQPLEEACSGSDAARRFLVLYSGAAKQGGWGGVRGSAAVALHVATQRMLLQAAPPPPALSLRAACVTGGREGGEGGGPCQPSSLLTLGLLAPPPLAPASPSSEISGERDYLTRLAATRTAAAAAKHLGEEALAAAVTAEGEQAAPVGGGGGGGGARARVRRRRRRRTRLPCWRRSCPVPS